jgi:serine protease Do
MIRHLRVALLSFALLPAGAALAASGGPRLRTAISETIDAAVQAKAVKIYGAGGFQGLSGYQSGMLISPEGHVLTVFSHVLDTDELHVTLNDGRRFEAKLLGADPRLEVAVLKIEAANLPSFNLDQAIEVEEGTRVLAFSNMFGVATGNEPVTVQHGTIAVKTQLEARRGVFETPYNGPVYVLDMTTNNPGAEGGLLVTPQGELVAMLGKELRNARNGTYLNYAVPIAELRESVKSIREGKSVAKPAEAKKKPDRPVTLAALGLGLVPDVVDRTPPYLDRVLAGSPAAAAGLKPDDLVVLVGDHLIQSCKALKDELERIDEADPVKLTVLRAQEMVEVTLKAQPGDER